MTAFEGDVGVSTFPAMPPAVRPRRVGTPFRKRTNGAPSSRHCGPKIGRPPERGLWGPGGSGTWARASRCAARLATATSAAILVTAYPTTAWADGVGAGEEVRVQSADGCDVVIRLPRAQGDPSLITDDEFVLHTGGVTTPGCGPIAPRP